MGRARSGGEYGRAACAPLADRVRGAGRARADRSVAADARADAGSRARIARGLADRRGARCRTADRTLRPPPARHRARSASRRLGPLRRRRARHAAHADPCRRQRRHPELSPAPAGARQFPLRRHAVAAAFRPAPVAAVADRRRAAVGARVPQLRAARGLRAVQRRTGFASGRCAHQTPSRRRHRLPPDARVPRRRQHAPNRLEGHGARAS